MFSQSVQLQTGTVSPICAAIGRNVVQPQLVMFLHRAAADSNVSSFCAAAW
jgi:hypothetical protein